MTTPPVLLDCSSRASLSDNAKFAAQHLSPSGSGGRLVTRGETKLDIVASCHELMARPKMSYLVTLIGGQLLPSESSQEQLLKVLVVLNVVQLIQHQGNRHCHC